MVELPPQIAQSSIDRRARNWLVLGTLFVLGIALLPAWFGGWDVLVPEGITPDWGRHIRNSFDEAINQFASFYLLPAMGMCLVLGCGKVDLSVWGVAGLGGVLAATLINAGVFPAWAFAVAIAAGGGLGMLNGAAAACSRVPSALTTLTVGVLAMLIADGMTPEKSVPVPGETFGRWLIVREVAVEIEKGGTGSDATTHEGKDYVVERRTCSPTVTRMLLAAGTYSVTMISLIVWGVVAPARIADGSRRRRIALAMTASGALAAAAGCFWLVEHNTAPVLTRPIGDLRGPAAALLAGGWILTGSRKSLRAGLCLPLALLLTTIWREQVPGLRSASALGYATQGLLLAAMVLTAQLAMARSLRFPHRRWVLMTSLAAAVIGTAVVATQASFDASRVKSVLHILGVSIWALAVAALVVGWMARRRVRNGQVPP